MVALDECCPLTQGQALLDSRELTYKRSKKRNCHFDQSRYPVTSPSTNPVTAFIMLGTHYYTQILFVSACQFCHVFTPVIDKNESFIIPDPIRQMVSFGCNSHQGVPRQTFSLFLLKRQHTVAKKKMKRNKTTHRTKMPGRTLLSFAHSFCFGTLSFAEGKIEYPTDLIIKRSLFFFCKLLLLAYCLAEGASPTADGAECGGGVATLITGSDRPNPWQQYGCNFHQLQRVLANLFLALEKARKSVLREMSIRTFLSGNWKNSSWTIIGPWTTKGGGGGDCYSESKLERLTAVWPFTIAIHSPIKVFWTAYEAVDRYTAMDRYRVPHVKKRAQ